MSEKPGTHPDVHIDMNDPRRAIDPLRNPEFLEWMRDQGMNTETVGAIECYTAYGVARVREAVLDENGYRQADPACGTDNPQLLTQPRLYRLDSAPPFVRTEQEDTDQ